MQLRIYFGNSKIQKKNMILLDCLSHGKKAQDIKKLDGALCK